MAKVDLSKVIEEVENILGTSERIDVDANDAKIAGVIVELQKARTRLELTKRGLAVDFDASSDNLTIYRVGASIVPPPANPTEKKTKTPKKKPAPKRSQHTFVPPEAANDIIDVLNDEASHVVWFQGPTGTGKTVLAHHLARELGMVLHQVNGHHEMGHEDFFGDNRT
jgi:chromosomal replication initiation ATPase DnaA